MTFTPPPTSDAMFPGIVGEWLRAVEPYTEAHPAAIALHLVIGFGNAVGRAGDAAHCVNGAVRHGLNLFGLAVGETSDGAKGEAEAAGLMPLRAARIPNWRPPVGGLHSGEGLVWHVRDPIAVEDKKHPGETKLVPGVEDKRLLVIESEMAGPFKLFRGKSNILSQVLRDAWDGKPLGHLIKTAPASCAEPHISVVGHATPRDLLAHVEDLDAFNGQLNRWLFCACKRVRLIDEADAVPGALVESFGTRLRTLVDRAQRAGRLERTPEARAAWSAAVEGLARSRPGLLGALLARSRPMALRLSGLLAAMNGRSRIGLEEHEAALAWWAYSAASAAVIFGARTGNPVADRLLEKLCLGKWVTRTAAGSLAGDPGKAALDDAFELLVDLGLAEVRRVPTRGKPRDEVRRISGGAFLPSLGANSEGNGAPNGHDSEGLDPLLPFLGTSEAPAA